MAQKHLWPNGTDYPVFCASPPKIGRGMACVAEGVCALQICGGGVATSTSEE